MFGEALRAMMIRVSLLQIIGLTDIDFIVVVHLVVLLVPAGNEVDGPNVFIPVRVIRVDVEIVVAT